MLSEHNLNASKLNSLPKYHKVYFTFPLKINENHFETGLGLNIAYPLQGEASMGYFYYYSF